jgi:tRNA-2-methylthio-N6-dimethylallyladenosine synthase
MTAFGHENMDRIVPTRETLYTAFVTISRGCNNCCAYCIVPHVRGAERAHSPGQIIDSVKRLVGEGVVEITLLGQNVNSYRHGDTDFPKLVERVAHETDIQRIRFMTSHPKDLSERLVDVMADEPRMMPHIHLPLQSGCNRILEKMGRQYTVERYLKIIEHIRSKLDYVAVTTDLIVGFPSETETEYERTLDVVRQVQYDAAFMFRYSVRPGTPAARYEDDVPEQEKIRRLNRLIDVQQQIAYSRNQREVNQIRRSLVEGTSRRSSEYLRARTGGNKTVLFRKDGVDEGTVVPVRITSADAFTLHGVLQEPN